MSAEPAMPHDPMAEWGGSEAVVELTLPSDPKYLALVRIVVAATAGAIPSLSEARIADLKLVATELFANAMEANWRTADADVAPGPGSGNTSGSVRRHDHTSAPPVRVTCRASATGVVVTVADSGPGLDHSHDPHPPVEDPDRLDHERGLGIPLIQYLADEVDYVTGDDGTSATVTLVDPVGEHRTS